MKKVMSGAVLASLVMAAAGAQAATIVEKDGFTYKLKGDWQIQLRQDHGEDQDLDVEFDDLELKNYISYDLTEGLKAFGELDYGFKNAADKGEDPHLEEAYLGMAFGDGKFVFGKTGSAADEFGVAGYKETVVEDDAFDDVGATSGDDLLKISYDFGMAGIIAAYELNPESEHSSANGSFYDAYVYFTTAGFTVAGAYQNFQAADAEILDETTGEVIGMDYADDVNIYGISAEYDAEFMAIAADYSIAEDIESIWNIFVSAPVSDYTFGVGYQMTDYDADDADDVAGWYANVTYKFPTQKNVSLFAEVANSDEDNSDIGFLAGMRLKF